MNGAPVCTAADAIYKLAAGNLKYLNAENGSGDISRRVRLSTWAKGQSPYAIIVTCSDSRVIPENIFSAGIGELFVIRLAGNVIDDHQLGSIEYAAGHLGCRLVVVLGHTHCGAVDAAIHHEPSGYIKFITDEIKKAIGDEKPITCRPADLLEPELSKIEAEMSQWKEQDEDVLTYALFPQVATEFFKYRAAQENKIDPVKADVENGAYPV